MNKKSNEIIEVRKLWYETMRIAEGRLSVCNQKIEKLTHPEIYGACLTRCNCIVINKERMMTITTNAEHRTTYEFSPLYPTFFTRETACDIVKLDIYKDINGNRIALTIVGELEYYELLQESIEKGLKAIKATLEMLPI